MQKEEQKGRRKRKGKIGEWRKWHEEHEIKRKERKGRKGKGNWLRRKEKWKKRKQNESNEVFCATSLFSRQRRKIYSHYCSASGFGPPSPSLLFTTNKQTESHCKIKGAFHWLLWFPNQRAHGGSPPPPLQYLIIRVKCKKTQKPSSYWERKTNF